MSLAFSRAPRKTAGNRMSRLLDAEEEDEFYKTTYGGFHDESGDEEYKGDLSETEDEVDSDFDIDEGDEPDSEQEEDGPRRKSRVVTKAYKEPVKVVKQKPKPRKPTELPRRIDKTKINKYNPPELQEDISKNRKSVRQSTTEHTRLTYLRLQERQVAPRRRKENYERLEANKKRQVHMKRQCVGSVIRYHSVLMPLVSDVSLKEENVDVEGLDQDAQQNPGSQPTQSDSILTTPSALSNAAAVNASVPPGAAKCSRTYITFSDDETFQHFFSHSQAPRIPAQEVCPVTHKPALYRDPITDIPYANVQAFRIIREAYKKYVAAHGLPCTGTVTPTDTTAKNLRQKIIIKQGM
ncbi:vacuolar protein sorting-associated protein 72 homolog isoform X2 [Myxocyprinus asiaticus]|uniref:vacuolar protein sorting-associated protein 72 homolog isoform X2 n=1 Tax=Myxocyprinus asiaticus TaxID=70543 RepID=UPI002223C599|nr:vacuolar protein sorting-associated protein 72 homolog isoform X2 [Myxocyprinus asiaticus]